MIQQVYFDGPCPFLTCFESGPHDHPVCPDCRAMRWGNASCPTCRSHWPEEFLRLSIVVGNLGKGQG